MPLIKLNATQGLTGTLPAVSGANLTNIDGGKVLQVVQGTHSTEDNFGNTSYQATETDLNITPSATSSKVFVQVSLPFHVQTTNDEWVYTIYRDSTNIALDTNRGFGTLRVNATVYSGTVTYSFLDTPNTTSQIHYEAYVKRASGSGDLYLNYNTAGTSTITAYEIGA